MLFMVFIDSFQFELYFRFIAEACFDLDCSSIIIQTGTLLTASTIIGILPAYII